MGVRKESMVEGCFLKTFVLFDGEDCTGFSSSPPSLFFYTRKKGKETIEIRKLISGCAFICEVNFRLEFIVGRDFSRD